MKYYTILSLGFAMILSAACSGDASPTPDLEATLEVALAQTLTAQPTHTAISTSTPVPTGSSTPTPSERPTETPIPPATEPEEEKPFIVETLDNGWMQYIYETDGFSIALPPDWQHLDLTASDLEQMFAFAGENNSTLSSLFSTTYLRSLAASGIKFLGVDTDISSLSAGIPTSVNMLVSDLIIDIEFDDYIELSLQQLESAFGEDTPIQNDRIEMDGREAEKIMYESELNDVFGMPHTVVFTQYIILEGKTQYILTFGSVKELYDANQDFFSDIVDSYQLFP